MKPANLDSIDFSKVPYGLQKIVKLQKWLSNISYENDQILLNKILNSSFIDKKNISIFVHEVLSVVFIRPFSMDPLAQLINNLLEKSSDYPDLLELPQLILDQLFSPQFYSQTPKCICLLNFARPLFKNNIITIANIHDFLLKLPIHSDVFTFLFFLFYNELKISFETTFNKYKNYVTGKASYRFIANFVETEILNEYHDYGYPKSSIEYALKYDDLDLLLSMSAVPGFDVNNVITISKFDNSSWLFPRKTNYVWFAAYYGSIRCFKYLTLSGANTKNVPVFAVCSGCLEIIHYCDQKNHSFKNMFYEAVKFRRNDIFDWLVNHEGLLKVQLRDIAISDGGSGNAIAFSGFLEAGLQLKTVDIDGSTLLHKVAYNGDISIGSFLLKSRIQISAQDNEGQTPLHIAVACGHLAFVRLILQKCKVDEIFDRQDRTALHIAAAGCDSRITNELVKFGFSPNSKRRKGTTPLITAIKNSQLNNVVVLVEAGAIPNGKNKDAMKIAKSLNQNHIVEYLSKHGF